jgi:hypothetical protein
MEIAVCCGAVVSEACEYAQKGNRVGSAAQCYQYFGIIVKKLSLFYVSSYFSVHSAALL